MIFGSVDNVMSEYIDRTIENLRIIEETTSKQGSYEVTQLINSFVGLLILPKEKIFDGIDDSYVSDETLNQLKKYICCSKEEKNLKNIIRHLRNGVAHFNMKFSGSGRIEEIEIKDRENFKATFDIKFLKSFILEFAENVKTRSLNSEK